MPPTPPEGAEWGIGGRLAPVAIAPDVAAALVDPFASNPDGVSVGWLDIRSADPDVAISVPAVVALMPGPVGVFVRWWGYALDDVGRGPMRTTT